MFTHFFHFNVHLARDFQIEIFMQFGALLVASSDRNLRDFERFSGLGQPTKDPLWRGAEGEDRADDADAAVCPMDSVRLSCAQTTFHSKPL